MEVDFVFQDGTALVIAEVKYRRKPTFGGAAGAVTARKRRFLQAAAQGYLRLHGTKARVRFDVIAITGTRNGLQLEHIRNAFQAKGR